MKDIGRLLRDGDPVALEPEMSAADIQAVRRAVLARARDDRSGDEPVARAAAGRRGGHRGARRRRVPRPPTHRRRACHRLRPRRRTPRTPRARIVNCSSRRPAGRASSGSSIRSSIHEEDGRHASPWLAIGFGNGDHARGFDVGLRATRSSQSRACISRGVQRGACPWRRAERFGRRQQRAACGAKGARRHEGFPAVQIVSAARRPVDSRIATDGIPAARGE